jgi:ABC-type nitrate/sulfonate/bicarbonate transport system permease component
MTYRSFRHPTPPKRRIKRLALETGIRMAGYSLVYETVRAIVSKPAFPPLLFIIRTFVNVMPAVAALNIAATLSRWTVLFAVGAFGGTAFGVLVGISRRAHRALATDLDFFRSLPATALLVFFLALFGDGDLARGLPALYITFFTVLFYVAKHVAGIDRDRIRHLRDLGAGWAFIVKHCLLWEVATPAFIAIRQAISLSFLVLISIELIIGSSNDRGLGTMIYKAKENLRYGELISGLFIIGMLGFVLNALWNAAQTRFVPWESAE